jgi:hypothetical protein
MHRLAANLRRLAPGSLGAMTLAVVTAGAAHAGAVTQKFVGPFGGPSPCNGEFVFGSGPGHATYQESQAGTHFFLLFTMTVKATGSLGNDYLRDVRANGQFDSPSLTFANGTTAFDMPVRLVAVSQGDAPNYESVFTVRIFVFDHQPVGSTFLGPATSTCHG